MRTKGICIVALCLGLAGCGGHQATSGGGLLPNPHGASPLVVQTGTAPVQWTQFAWGDAVNPHQFNGVVTGSDKNMWLTDYNGQALIKMTMAGKATKFALTYNAGTHFYPGQITVGKDNKFYMGSNNASGILGVATTTGSFSTKTIPSGDYNYDGGLTLGSDGNVWFTELQHVAKITTGGTITEFSYPDGNTANYYGAITAGPDGDVWATEYNANSVDDIDPATGNITQYNVGCSPIGLVSAVDGNLYTICSTNLVRVTTSGNYQTIALPFGADGYPSSLTLGPDGNPWFTANSASHNLVRYNTANNSLTVYQPPTAFGASYGLAAGPDGNMWALDSGGKVDVYILNVLGVSPSSITFHVGNTQTITVTEPGTTSWTATSSSPGVASVAAGGQPNKFVVTANGLGNTNVTVKDAIGNSFVVKTKVN